MPSTWRQVCARTVKYHLHIEKMAIFLFQLRSCGHNDQVIKVVCKSGSSPGPTQGRMRTNSCCLFNLYCIHTHIHKINKCMRKLILKKSKWVNKLKFQDYRTMQINFKLFYIFSRGGGHVPEANLQLPRSHHFWGVWGRGADGVCVCVCHRPSLQFPLSH